MVNMKNSNKAWGALFALAVLVGHKLTLDNNDQIITSKYAWLKNAGLFVSLTNLYLKTSQTKVLQLPAAGVRHGSVKTAKF